MQDYLKKAKQIARSFFKIDGEPFELSDGQAEIFADIFFRRHLRSQLICPTQYGKSLTVACAVLMRAVSCQESFTILAPSEKKAKITMNYVIEHAFDHPVFYSQLELDKSESLDRLKRERSKNKINFMKGGGVQVLTLDARNSKRSMEAAMGFGGKRIIVDEAALIEDQLISSVIRMMGGYKYDDTYLMKIGNPFYRNHFLRTWRGDRYHKVFIDYHQALKEGRYAPQFIEEMREEALFDVYYECRFPSQDEIDADGYRFLITEEEYEQAQVSKIADEELKGGKLGVDVGGGGDKSSFVIRKGDVVRKVKEHQSTDTMTNISVIRELKTEFDLNARDIKVEDTGIGRGVSDRCLELDDLMEINPISPGSKAGSEKYANVRAEDYFTLRHWIKSGGKIETGAFKHLLAIKFKKDSSDRIIIEPKDRLKKRIGRSPDDEDALSLTFAIGQPVADVDFI